MKKILILAVFAVVLPSLVVYGQSAKKVDTTVITIDVTKEVQKIFPDHDYTPSTTVTEHYRYDAVGNRVLHITEQAGFIIVIGYRYDRNGNVITKIVADWVYNTNDKGWHTAVPTAQIAVFKAFFERIPVLFVTK